MENDEYTSLEIERKFLVMDHFPRAAKPIEIIQGYLPDIVGKEIRIRSENGEFFLTRKDRIDMVTAEETSCSIPSVIGRDLWNLCSGGSLVRKRRHHIHISDHIWEIDEYLDKNAGLLVAEIELCHKDESFYIPAWVGEEVTHKPEFKNLALFKNPYKNGHRDQHGA